MNCRKLMTSNPASCTPNDTVARAAKLMKSEDVGPIPVVMDKSDKRLVGIVTDRDLTLKVLAEGRDPEMTLVESVMTSNPISCREDQDINEALRAMSEHQVRRIPIVDRQHRLTGIIAQADVARKMHDETVGAVVEDISERRGMLGWPGGSYEPSQPKSATKNAAIAVSLGAGLMYLLDPNRGSARRAYIRDQASSVSQKTKDIVDAAGEGIRKTTEGARSLFGDHSASGDSTVARVTAALGRAVSHPRAINVSSHDGRITLSGAALTHEVETLLSTVRSVTGVADVENRLTTYDTAEGHPEFQVSNWIEESKNLLNKPGMQYMAAGIGGGLALYGLLRKSRFARTAAATAGVAMVARRFNKRQRTSNMV
jgi:CBS domain-containing protein/osmotically-inducible protein OsmY